MTFQRTWLLNFTASRSHVPLSLTPPPPYLFSFMKVGLWHVSFGLLAVNGPLSAELKVRENTARVQARYPLTKKGSTGCSCPIEARCERCLPKVRTGIQVLFNPSDSHLTTPCLYSKTGWQGHMKL